MKTTNAPPDKIKSLFLKSAQLLQQGDAAGAKKGLLKVAKKIPDAPTVWYNLGLSHQHLAEFRESIAAYKKAVRLNPGFIDGWVNLGLCHKEMDSTADAEKAAQKALTIDQHHPRALNLLGTLEGEHGNTEEAQQLFERSLASLPDFEDARFNLANLHLETGNTDLALETGGSLFALQPDNKRYRQLHAQILINQKKFGEATGIVLRLQQEYPDDIDVLRLALGHKEVIRDHFGTIDIARKLLEEIPDEARIWNALGSAYFQLDSIENAKSCYEKAIALDTNHPEYENNIGLTFSSLGDKENAEKHYRRSIELNPRHAEAYRNIATMKRFKSADDPDTLAVKALWDEENLDSFTEIKLGFTLGKMYDDCGMYDEAFAAYKRGNDLKFLEAEMELDKYFQHIDRFRTVFDKPPVSIVNEEVSPQPIFILGMPRSGTTLVEQIICRHPDVTGCGELPCLEHAISRMERKSDPQRIYPNDFWDVPVDTLASEAKAYPEWVGRLHDIRTPLLTDKMPFNFAHTWLIRAMFPTSAIVHTRRHPLDVITSNYFQLYGTDISFVYNLEALTAYYVRYYQLMEHYQDVFGEAITEIQYEELVQDSETQIRRLIGKVGLPWDEACLNQETSSTAVRTASIWQVRQGIYTRSKERWRNYEKYLGPTIDTLVKEKIL